MNVSYHHYKRHFSPIQEIDVKTRLYPFVSLSDHRLCPSVKDQRYDRFMCYVRERIVESSVSLYVLVTKGSDRLGCSTLSDGMY